MQLEQRRVNLLSHERLTNFKSDLGVVATADLGSDKNLKDLWFQCFTDLKEVFCLMMENQLQEHIL